MQSLKDADNPLDFIRSNLRPVEPAVAALPTDTIKQVEAKRAEPIQSPVPEADKEPSQYPFSPKSDAKGVPADKSDSKVTDAKSVSSGDTTRSEEVISDDKEENFKILRKKAAELSSTVKEKEKTVEELQKKIKKYETGEEFPDLIKTKEARIAELERYEQLHALKISPAYKEKFIKPIETIKSKLTDIAKDYELPPELLEKALNITNKRELNGFLSEHFDEVGALEVKQLVTEAQTLRVQAEEAEREPSKAITELEESFKEIQATKRAQANDAIANISKEAWIDSLIKIKEEGKIPELIIKDDDPEHNKKYVEPVLQAASTEYGKIIRILTENGLEVLPKDVAFALARMVHLAHASGIALKAREIAERAAEEIKQNVVRTTRYERPSVGATVGSGQSSAPAPRSPTEAADMLINSVLAKRSS